MSNSTEQKVVKIIADGRQAEASINQITRAVAALNRERNKINDRNSDRYKELTKDLSGLNQRLTTARNEVKNLDSASKKFWTNFKTMAAGVVGGNLITSAIQGLGQFVSRIVDKQKEVSDAFANIRKVTGLTLEEVQRLDKSLGSIDTRTGRKELRELAVEAGKLGIDGVDNITKFVKEADQIKVALGEDLGEGAVTTIGRLSQIFKVSMLEIGSAINDIGASSAATEAYQVDFLNRMAGTGPTVKLAADELLGYSATLENMGQSAEVSGTALSKFFIEFIKDTEKFGAIAGMQQGKLTEIFNSKGTNAAFLTFLENLKQSRGGAKQMADALDEMNIDGARSVGVFLSLANSIENVHQNQSVANKGLTEGISLTNEFNIKNETFAAKWEKLMKAIQGGIQNSGIAKLISNITSSIVEMTTNTDAANQEFKLMIQNMYQAQESMNVDLEILKDNNLTQEARKDLIHQVNEAYGEYLPYLLTEKSSIEDITKAQELANKAFERNIFLKISQKRLEEEQLKLFTAQENLKKKEIELARLEKKTVVSDDIKQTYGVEGKAYQKGLINLQTNEKLKKDIADAKENVEELNQIINELSKEKYGKSVNQLLDEKISGTGGGSSSSGSSSVGKIKTKKYKSPLKDGEVDGIGMAGSGGASFEGKVDRAQIDADLKRFREEKQREKDKEMEKKELALNIASEVSDTTFELLKLRQEKELNSQLDFLEKKKNVELSNEKLTAEQRAKIEADYQKKRSAILTENAKKEKRAAVIRSVIDMALAIAKASAAAPPPLNIPLITMASVTGAAQTALIAAQPIPQFQKGGVTAEDGKRYMAENVGSFSGGGIYNAPSVGLIGEKGSELVIPNWLYKSPKMVNTMAALESMIYNPKTFASGGATAPTAQNGTSFDDKELKMVLAMNANVMKELNKSLQKGIVAKTYYDRVEFEKYEARNAKTKSISKL